MMNSIFYGDWGSVILGVRWCKTSMIGVWLGQVYDGYDGSYGHCSCFCWCIRRFNFGISPGNLWNSRDGIKVHFGKPEILISYRLYYPMGFYWIFIGQDRHAMNAEMFIGQELLGFQARKVCEFCRTGGVHYLLPKHCDHWAVLILEIIETALVC